MRFSEAHHMEGTAVATPSRRNRLSDMAASYVREAIIEGRFAEGTRLFPEKLSDELGISVTPAREALLAVEGEGFVEMLPRKGFVVSPLTADDVRDIFTSQALICGELASRAAERMTADQLEELERTQSALEVAVETRDFDAFSAANHQFHRIINLAANARKMLWLLTITLRYTPTTMYSETPGWTEASCTDHRSIVQALKDRDPEAARQSMSWHMNHLGGLLADRRNQNLIEADLPSQAAT